MNLAIGIVGMPNVGKSTLFNALTKSKALAANYPFATIEPNIGIVPVPDARLPELAKLYNSTTIMPASVKFVDIAGLVKGAAEGQGLGNQFLAHIREVDAICHVVRAFEKGDVIHVDNSIDPSRDIETIETELILADLNTVTNYLPRAEREAKSDPKKKKDVTLLEHIRKNLAAGTPINRSEYAEIDPDEASHDTLGFIRQLITAKPVIYVFNIDETEVTNHDRQKELAKIVEPAPAIFISADLEAELATLEDEERSELLAEVGLNQTGLERLVELAYHTLGLQSYLTAGPKEVRAWTIRTGSTAPEAAGVIHTDFQRGFIAAEVVNYNDLVEAGSIQAARAKGVAKTEGKNYVMKPDDVVEFRFNV